MLEDKPWHPTLLSMLAQTPFHETPGEASSQEIPCPSRMACIREQFGNAGVDKFYLLVCTVLTIKKRAIKACQGKIARLCRALSSSSDEREQTNNMRQRVNSTVAGVTGNKLIPVQHL